MNNMQVLGVQTALSTVAWSAVAVCFAWPWLRDRPARRAIQILLIPQLFRHVGMSLLAVGVAAPTLPTRFARHVAFGDLTTAVLALVALVALVRQWRGAIALTWLFNTVGLADLLFNAGNGMRLRAADHLGAGLYVVAFVVPAMAVIHVMIFRALIGLRRSTA